MAWLLPGAHRMLWTREHVTPYTTNTTGEIQTLCPVLHRLLLKAALVGRSASRKVKLGIVKWSNFT